MKLELKAKFENISVSLVHLSNLSMSLKVLLTDLIWNKCDNNNLTDSLNELKESKEYKLLDNIIDFTSLRIQEIKDIIK